MYEEKLREKLKLDRQAVDEMFKLLSSMVENGPKVPRSDQSLAAITTVLYCLGVKNPKVFEGDEVKKNYSNIFQSYGILTRSVILEDGWWMNATGPFLGRDDEGNFVALVPDFLGYYKTDFKTGKKTHIRHSKMEGLQREAICFCRELPRRKLSMKDLYKYTIQTIKVKNIVYVVLFCLVVVLLGMLVPFANKIIFNDVVPAGVPAGVIPICSFLLGVGISAALFKLYRDMVLVRVKNKFNANLQAAVMARVYSLPNRFFKEYSAGDLSARALSVNTVHELISSELLATVAMGVFSVMYIFVAIFFAKDIMWLIMLIVVVINTLSFIVYKKFSARNSEVLPYKTATQGFIFSLLSGIHKIRNNGAELRAMQQWSSRFSKSEFVSADAPFFIRNQKTIAFLIFKLSFFSIFYFAWKAEMSISDFIAFNAAFGVMFTAMDELQLVMMELSQMVPQMKLIEPILDAVPESVDDSELVDFISGGVEISNVTFRYGPNTAPVVNNLSLKIRPGENIGIVGFSGCGKSSLMRLMMGFEQPSSGSIFYDQYNLAHTNLNSLHQHTGYCPQDLHIFPDTIYNNIRISKPDATEEEVWEAARIACIDEDIKRMPEGMYTRLGEGGSGVSGGQGQRIMIARAVLNRPRIMFFDEATSALDNITQRQVVKNLGELNCTMVSIAHRLSTIEHCDRIIVLDKGNIIEEGSPAELMAKEGFFYKLAKRQQL